MLSLTPGDASYDWLDVIDHIGNITVLHRDDALTRLARKLGLSQTPGKAAATNFARRVGELQAEGGTKDQAATIAAKETFPSEFQPNRYAGQSESIARIIRDIETISGLLSPIFSPC